VDNKTSPEMSAGFKVFLVFVDNCVRKNLTENKVLRQEL